MIAIHPEVEREKVLTPVLFCLLTDIVLDTGSPVAETMKHVRAAVRDAGVRKKTWGGGTDGRVDDSV